MPRLIVQSPEFANLTFDLLESEISVGRAADNKIHIEHGSLSSHHAVLTSGGGDYTVRDLNSTNGTRVNGNRIAQQRLQRGDILQLGNIEAYYDSEIGGAQQPLPDPTVGNEYGSETSERPSNYANVSPFGRKIAVNESAGKQPQLILTVLAVLAGLAFLALLVRVFTS
jgi:predicted component of type VI protein secretion system